MALHIIGYFVISILTIALPRCSLFLFIVLSPWSQFGNEALEWDPRVGWSLILALRAYLLPKRHDEAPLSGSAFWASLAFLSVAGTRLLSASSEVPADELRSAATMLLYFGAGLCAGYAVLRLAQSSQDASLAAQALAWSLIVAGGFNLLQAPTLSAVGRIAGTTGNANYSGAQLALASVVALFCWRRLRGRLYLAAVLIGVTGCFLTFSRMAVIACIIGLLLTWQVTRAGKTLTWKMIVFPVALLAIAMGLGRGYLASLRNTHASGVESRHAEVEQELADLTRLEALAFSLQTFLEQPIFGGGFGTVAARNYAVNGIYVTSHNTYAQVLAGAGLVGAVLMLSLIGGVQRCAARPLRRYVVPFWAALAFCGFFVDLLQALENFVSFAVLFAIVRQMDGGPVWEGQVDRTQAHPVIHLNRTSEAPC